VFPRTGEKQKKPLRFIIALTMTICPFNRRKNKKKPLRFIIALKMTISSFNKRKTKKTFAFHYRVNDDNLSI